MSGRAQALHVRLDSCIIDGGSVVDTYIGLSYDRPIACDRTDCRSHFAALNGCWALGFYLAGDSLFLYEDG